jgi:hypothetical protein
VCGLLWWVLFRFDLVCVGMCGGHQDIMMEGLGLEVGGGCRGYLWRGFFFFTLLKVPVEHLRRVCLHMAPSLDL